MAKKNYWITQHSEGWQAKREGSNRASGIFDTQWEAENFARDILQNNPGGGELVTQNREGKIRSKDTINRPDYNPPKDTEH